MKSVTRSRGYRAVAVTLAMGLSLCAALGAAQPQATEDTGTNPAGEGSATTLSAKQQEYEQRFRTASEKKDLGAIAALAKEIDAAYQPEAASVYAQLVLQITSQLGSHDFGDPAQFDVAQVWTMRALERAEAIPLMDELDLASHLRFSQFPPQATPAEQDRLRTTKATLWLHAWSRMNKTIDRNFDFSHEPWINVPLPPGVPAPSGIAPEAIKDPVTRAVYAHDVAANKAYAERFHVQYQLKLKESLFTEGLEGFLVGEYSVPSANTDELHRLLAKYGVDEGLSTRVLRRIEVARADERPSASSRPSTAPATKP